MTTESIAPEVGSTAPAPSRRWILLAVALVALGGAGWSIWSSAGSDIQAALVTLREQVTAPPPPATPPVTEPVADHPIGAEEPANWSEVAIFRAGENRPRPVVVFRRAAQPIDINDGVMRGLITREIIRQAFILTARERFDVVVRDRAAGDPDEPGTADATYRLGSLLHARERQTNPPTFNGARITVVQGTGADRKVIWHRNLDVMQDQFPNYGKFVGQVERLTRSDLPAVLAGWRLPSRTRPTPVRDPDALPSGVAKRLDSLMEADQFAAIRALHDAIRRDGGSPARWIALARGYAMLGSLTEPLLSGIPAVFKARGLLYAQAVVVVEQDSPQSLRSQAFVEAMADFMFAARNDLNLADETDGGKGATPRDATVRAYLDTNPAALAQIAHDNPDDPLPLYLRGLVLTRVLTRAGNINRSCRNELITALDEALARAPGCNRLMDALNEASGVSNLHRATLIGLESFALTSARQVAALPGLPPTLTSRFEDGAAVEEVALRQALDEAATLDTNDLTWGAFAQILREIRFWQVCRRLYFLAFPLGAGADDFVDEARPMLADHPSRGFIELYSGELDQAHAAHTLDRVDFADLQMKNYPMLYIVRSYDQQRHDALYRRGMIQSDHSLLNIQELLAQDETTNDRRSIRARDLFNIDKTSPIGRAILVNADWASVAAKVPDWEREQPWNTPLIAEHGFQLLKLNRAAEAQERFETALGRSPESWIFRGLAEVYRDGKQIDKWVKAAEAILDQPDQGLDHATICNDLAKYLMDEGEIDRAWPWAERGAESWAAWAMNTAWLCAERRRDWKNAEIWIARGSQRYANQWLDWLIWSLRTGHGHVPEAAALVWAQWDAGRPASSEIEESLISELGLILDRPDVSRAIAEKRLETKANSTDNLANLALACDQLGDTKARDEALDRIARATNPTAPITSRILGELIEWNRQRDADTLPATLDRVRILIDKIPADNRPPTESLVGCFLILFGQPKEAVPHLKQADVRANAVSSRLVARHALEARGEPLADALYPGPKTATPAEAPREP